MRNAPLGFRLWNMHAQISSPAKRSTQELRPASQSCTMTHWLNCKVNSEGSGARRPHREKVRGDEFRKAESRFLSLVGRRLHERLPQSEACGLNSFLPDIPIFRRDLLVCKLYQLRAVLAIRRRGAWPSVRFQKLSRKSSRFGTRRTRVCLRLLWIFFFRIILSF